MSIESNLKSIAESLAIIAEKIGTAPAPAVTDDDTEPDTDDLLGLGDDDTPDEITIDVLRDKLKDLVEAQSADVAVALLKKFKAKKLSDVKEKDFEKLADAIDKKM